MMMPWSRAWRRKRILKGILRDNLVILGLEPFPRHRKRFITPGLTFAAVAGGILLIHSAYVNTFTRPEGAEVVFADPVAPQPPRAPAAVAGRPSVPDSVPDGSTGRAAPPSFLAPTDYKGMTSPGAVPIKQVLGLGVRTVMIDPGHGGADKGAIGKEGTWEKDITLDISLKLRDMLRLSTGCTILLTREEDIDLSLKDRVALANSRGVDIFVSVHVNSLPSKTWDFIETYYFGPSSDRAMLDLAAAENVGSSYNISDYQQVIKEIANQLKYQESRDMAGRIQSTLFSSMKERNNDLMDFGIKRAPFVVLLDVDMPGVLVEVACLSNREEENRLRDPAYRESIAGYLERGIISYLNDRSSS